MTTFRFAGSALVALATLIATTYSSHAQSSRISPFPLTTPNAQQKGVDISVSYQFFINGDANDLDAQADLSEKGRRAVYTLLGRECDTLLETIAETCEISRANVNSQINRRRLRKGGIRVSGSATYRITFKVRKRKPEADE